MSSILCEEAPLRNTPLDLDVLNRLTPDTDEWTDLETLPTDQNEEGQNEDSCPIKAVVDRKANETYGNVEALESDDDDEWNNDDFEKCQTPWASELGYNAKRSVQDWIIRSVGQRPQDFIARDVLFGSLFRDYRVPWFKAYVKRPSRWMTEMVRDLPEECHRTAFEYLSLHYMHKLHLARMVERAVKDFGENGDEMRTISRLWKCAPCTVMLERKPNGKRWRWAAPPHPCNLHRLCPWCFARRATTLYNCIRKSVLTDVEGKHLLLAKVRYVDENGYYEEDKARAIETQKSVIMEIGDALPKMSGGVLVNQMGSSRQNGIRSFLHDVGVVGVVSDPTHPFFEGGLKNGKPARWALKVDKDLVINLLIVPADRPSALRALLAGSSYGFKGETFGLQEGDVTMGIGGAMGWQPTFLFGDDMWFAYLDIIKHQRLYQPFGDWRDKLPEAMVASRETVDQKFRRAQQNRLEEQKQQKGNRRRQGEVDRRRQELLKVVEPLWPRVVMATQGSRGRPAYRSRLEDELKVQRVEISSRDLEWLVKNLRSRDGIGERTRNEQQTIYETGIDFDRPSIDD